MTPSQTQILLQDVKNEVLKKYNKEFWTDLHGNVLLLATEDVCQLYHTRLLAEAGKELPDETPMTQEKAIQEAKLVSKEDIAKKHLARYYQHKGKGSSINLDDIMPMSRILPMMDEYAKEYHRFHLTPASSSSEKGDKSELPTCPICDTPIQDKDFHYDGEDILMHRNCDKDLTHQSSEQFSLDDLLEWLNKEIEVHSFKESQDKGKWIAERRDTIEATLLVVKHKIEAHLTPKEHSEGEIQARDLLDECRLQLEYLNDKFKETGTTNSVLAKVKAFLDQPPKI